MAQGSTLQKSGRTLSPAAFRPSVRFSKAAHDLGLSLAGLLRELRRFGLEEPAGTGKARTSHLDVIIELDRLRTEEAQARATEGRARVELKTTTATA